MNAVSGAAGIEINVSVVDVCKFSRQDPDATVQDPRVPAIRTRRVVSDENFQRFSRMIEQKDEKSSGAGFSGIPGAFPQEMGSMALIPPTQQLNRVKHEPEGHSNNNNRELNRHWRNKSIERELYNNSRPAKNNSYHADAKSPQ